MPYFARVIRSREDETCATEVKIYHPNHVTENYCLFDKGHVRYALKQSGHNFYFTKSKTSATMKVTFHDLKPLPGSPI